MQREMHLNAAFLLQYAQIVHVEPTSSSGKSLLLLLLLLFVAAYIGLH